MDRWIDVEMSIREDKEGCSSVVVGRVTVVVVKFLDRKTCRRKMRLSGIGKEWKGFEENGKELKGFEEAVEFFPGLLFFEVESRNESGWRLDCEEIKR